MNMSNILAADPKVVSNDEKLAQIVESVAGARQNYGNSNMEIPVPNVATPDGSMPIRHISVAGKLEHVKSELARIRTMAIESENDTGVVVERLIEKEVATSAILVNIGETTKYSLI